MNAPKTALALVVSSQTHGFGARMPACLKHAGYTVHAAHIGSSLVRHSSELAARHRLRAHAFADDLAKVLRALRPDALVPTDDIAAATLMGLRARADLAPIIAASLGDPAGYATACSKSAQMALAARLGLPIPATRKLDTLDDISDLLANNQPLLLKSDGSWGGSGVAVVTGRAEAAAAWHRMTRRPSLARACAAVLREGNLLSLAMRSQWQRPAVDAQELITGRPANLAVVCRQGRVLAAIGAEVLETATPGGPATVLRVIDHPGMRASAVAMVEALGLSGFLGFDFMIEAATGQARLIEMNPRATPISAIRSDHRSAGLAAALFSGQDGIAPPVPNGATIALFPGEWGRDPASAYLNTAFHDVPWDDRPLVIAYFDAVFALKRYHQRKERWLGWLKR